jgi:hypothetical protein
LAEMNAPAVVEAKKDEPAAAEAAKEAVEAKAEPAEEKPAVEPEKKEEAKEAAPRVSKSFLLLQEKERAATRMQTEAKRLLADAQTRAAAIEADPDLALVKRIKTELAPGGGGKVAALKLLGIDLQTGVEELARSMEDPTPEDIARRVAREEYEARQKSMTEQSAREKTEATERENARMIVARREYAMGCEQAFVAVADELPYLVVNEISSDQVTEFAARMEAATNKTPTHVEALRAFEKDLAEKDAKVQAKLAAKRKAPEPTKPAAPLAAAIPAKPKAEEQKTETGPEKRKVRHESAPIPLAMRQSKKPNAFERVAQALREEGLE